jgi:hypothetical protein
MLTVLTQTPLQLHLECVGGADDRIKGPQAHWIMVIKGQSFGTGGR